MPLFASLRGRALLVLAAIGGCQLIGDIADVDFAAPPPIVVATGGGGGAGGDGGAGGEELCPSPIPDKPEGASGADDVDVVLAMRRIEFGEDGLRETGVPTVGLDLDGAVTSCEADGETLTADAEEACIAPDGVFDQAVCDGECGIDNSMVRLVDFITSLLPIGVDGGASATLTADICRGSWTMILRIFDYDGSADDPQVSVAMYPVSPLGVDPCYVAGGGGAGGAGGAGGGAGLAECPGGTARWDGIDAWPVLSDSFADPTAAPAPVCPPPEDAVKALEPAYVDHTAWVAGGRLVARLPEAQLVVNATDLVLPIQLLAASIVGDLSESDGRWRLDDAVVSGRWPMEEVFAGMSRARLGGRAPCLGTNEYTVAKTAACSNRDMATVPGLIAPCDALSYAFALDAEEVRLGNVVMNPDLVSGCEPGTDPAGDTCE